MAPDTLIPPKKLCIGVNELEIPVVTPVTAPVNPLKDVTYSVGMLLLNATRSISAMPFAYQ